MRASRMLAQAVATLVVAAAGVTAQPAPRWVHVDAGRIRALYATSNADRRTVVGAFDLAADRVSNEEFRRFVIDHQEWRRSRVARMAADSPYLRHWAGDTVLGPAAPKRDPVVFVSWFAASAYAAWAGSRLPSTAEWELALDRGLVRGETPALPTSWEWVDDFNSIITSGESRGDGDPDKGLFCAGGAALATDPSDYAGFMRAALRASLKASYTLGSLGIRLARAGSREQATQVAAQPPLPRASLYAVPTTWTGADGAALPLASLRGAPVVIAMVYFSCTMTCPVITAELQAVQASLPADLRARTRFVLASFDSWRDSAPVLRAFAARMEFDARWTLLTAPQPTVRTLAALVNVSYRRLPSGDFEHANVITVLDADGVVRHQERRIPPDRGRLAKAIVAADAAVPSRSTALLPQPFR